MTQTARRVRAALERRGIRLRRSLGQHLLLDGNLVRKVAQAGELSERDVVLEVGPGTGALTELLTELAGFVYAVELDDRLVRMAREMIGERENLALVRMNALERRGRLNCEMVKALGEECAARDAGLKLVANLPYGITSPLLMGLLESDLPLTRVAVTVQREVAERITSGPGGRDYGMLSVVCQVHGKWEIARLIAGHVFFPRVEVESAILVGEITRERRDGIGDYESFKGFLKEAFRARRKRMVNSLRVAGKTGEVRERARELLVEMGHPADARTESLSVDELIRMWRALSV